MSVDRISDHPRKTRHTASPRTLAQRVVELEVEVLDGRVLRDAVEELRLEGAHREDDVLDRNLPRSASNRRGGSGVAPSSAQRGAPSHRGTASGQCKRRRPPYNAHALLRVNPRAHRLCLRGRRRRRLTQRDFVSPQLCDDLRSRLPAALELLQVLIALVDGAARGGCSGMPPLVSRAAPQALLTCERL